MKTRCCNLAPGLCRNQKQRSSRRREGHGFLEHPERSSTRSRDRLYGPAMIENGEFVDTGYNRTPNEQSLHPVKSASTPVGRHARPMDCFLQGMLLVACRTLFYVMTVLSIRTVDTSSPRRTIDRWYGLSRRDQNASRWANEAEEETLFAAPSKLGL